MSATRTQAYVSPEQRGRLDERARREGRTPAAVVPEAVDAYVTVPLPDLDAVLDESFGSMPDIQVPPRQ